MTSQLKNDKCFTSLHAQQNMSLKKWRLKYKYAVQNKMQKLGWIFEELVKI